MFLILVLGLLCAPSFAQAASPPDVVRLDDGGLLRGTIVELDPNGSVTIQLVTGEVRTIPMSEVTYAGEASGSQAGAAEPGGVLASGVSAAGPAVKVRVRSDLSNLTLHRYSGSAQNQLLGGNAQNGSLFGRSRSQFYEPICVAPCSFDGRVGTTRLGLELDQRGAVEADPIEITGAGVLEARYKDRRGTRIAGGVIGVTGLVVGAVMMIASVTPNDPFESTDGAVFGTGLGIGLGGILAATIMTNIRDGAELEYTRQ